MYMIKISSKEIDQTLKLRTLESLSELLRVLGWWRNVCWYFKRRHCSLSCSVYIVIVFVQLKMEESLAFYCWEQSAMPNSK